MTKPRRWIRFLTAGGGTVGIVGLSCVGATHAAPPTRTFGRGQIARAAGVAVDPATKQVYVADWDKQRILIFDRSGRPAGAFGRLGQGPGQFLSPQFVAVDSTGHVYVTDAGLYEKKVAGHDSDYLQRPCRIERFDRWGHYLGQYTFPENSRVHSIVAPRSGHGGVLAAVEISGDVHLERFDTNLRSLPVPSVAWSHEGAAAAENARGYWITASWDMKHNRLAAGDMPSGSVTETEIVHLDRRGKVLNHAVLHLEGLAAGVAADSDGRVYVAERVREVNEVGPGVERHGRHRVLVYNSQLKRLLSFTTSLPAGIAVDAGTVYVAGDRGVQVFHAANNGRL